MGISSIAYKIASPFYAVSRFKNGLQDDAITVRSKLRGQNLGVVETQQVRQIENRGGKVRFVKQIGPDMKEHNFEEVKGESNRPFFRKIERKKQYLKRKNLKQIARVRRSSTVSSKLSVKLRKVHKKRKSFSKYHFFILNR